MREHELQDLLGGLADRLDGASPPIDVELVLQKARASDGPGRRSLYLLSAAAVLVVVAAIVWARQAPRDQRTEVVSESQPRIEVVDAVGSIADGQVVQVAGTGFDPDSEITVQQCGTDGCDTWRPPVRTTADDDGQFVADVAVYGEIATGRGSTPGSPVEPGWSACTRCELKAEGGTVTARTPLFFDTAMGPPQHPTIRIATPPPYAPGQAVRLEGSGFRPDPDGLDVGVAYCAADAQRFEECGGGPDLGDFGIGADGSFVVGSFTLPPADVVLGGTSCADRPGACVVTWFLSTPGPLPAGVPLDLSGGEGR